MQQPAREAVDRRPADLADPGLEARAVGDRDLARPGLAGAADRLPLGAEVDLAPALDRDAAVLAAVDHPLSRALVERHADARLADAGGSAIQPYSCCPHSGQGPASLTRRRARS